MSVLRPAVVAALLLVLAGCGDDPDEESSGTPSGALVLTRGGDDLPLVSPVAGCRQTEDGTQVFYVAAGDIASSTGDAFFVSVPLLDLDLPFTLTLPTPQAGDAGDPAGLRAVFATAGGKGASGTGSASTGTVRVVEAACAPGSPVRVEVDVHLAADKAGDDDLDVSGRLTLDAIDLDAYFREQLAIASGSATPSPAASPTDSPS